jgi:uncharacterized protein YggE
MLKLIVTGFLMIVFFNAFSQSKSSNEIVAEGGAKTKVKPDMATFTLLVEKSDTNEKLAIIQLNKTVDGLVGSLSSVGFKNDNIKIATYDISSSVDPDNNKKTYTASNVLKIYFRIDNKLIDAFYTELQQVGITDLDVSFETNLSDSLEKAIRLKLVQQAIADAKINAENMAEALGLRIGKVKQVQKNGSTMLEETKIEMVKFTPPAIKREIEMRYNTPFDKFQVEDAELNERITVVYEILK